MQTSFTLAQLADPDVAEVGKDSARLRALRLLHRDLPDLRAATATNSIRRAAASISSRTCWRTTGRRRAEVALHIDRCLSCLACMTTCPSGVHYMHLVDHARAHIERHLPASAGDRLLRALLAGCCLIPSVSGWRWRRGFWASRSRRSPRRSGSHGSPPCCDWRPWSGPHAARRADVSGVGHGRSAAASRLLAGCVNDVLAPEINAAAIRVLTRHGVEVVVARRRRLLRLAGASHGAGRARRWRRRGPISMRGRRSDGLDAIVITASGCGTTVKDYGFMLRTDPAYAEPAARWRALRRTSLNISLRCRLNRRAKRPALSSPITRPVRCSTVSASRGSQRSCSANSASS